MRVVRGIGPQLVRCNHREQLIPGDGIALADTQLADLSGDLRADDDVVRRDDTGQHEDGRRGAQVGVGAAGGGRQHQEDEQPSGLGHAVSNTCIKHLFDRVTSRASPRAAGAGWHGRYTGSVLLRDLPGRGRWYILSIIMLGALVFCAFLPFAAFTPLLPLILLILLSSLTSAFKVQFPIASGSNMSVSYVVDIAALILRGPHATMLVGAAGGWSQSTLNAKAPNPLYRTLFNMAILVLTVQAAGQVYWRLGGTANPRPGTQIVVPLGAMAFTYFFVNTIPIAIAIALTTNQSPWRIWRTDFASSAPSYMIGAAAAAAIISVTESSGYWMTLLLASAPLYLTYKLYRAGAESEARQGAILEAAHDAIITMDARLNIREFNPAAERMFGYARLDVLGRNVELLLPPAHRARHVIELTEYFAHSSGPLARHQIEMSGLKADGSEFPIELSVARVGSDARAVL